MYPSILYSSLLFQSVSDLFQFVISFRVSLQCLDLLLLGVAAISIHDKCDMLRDIGRLTK